MEKYDDPTIVLRRLLDIDHNNNTIDSTLPISNEYLAFKKEKYQFVYVDLHNPLMKTPLFFVKKIQDIHIPMGRNMVEVNIF